MRLSLIVPLLWLTACGFTPVHGERATQSTPLAGLSQIAIHAPNTLHGNLFEAELSDLLNPEGQPDAPLYDLYVTLTTASEDLVILQDATAARQRIIYSAPFELKRRRDGAIVESGTVNYNNSLTALNDANFAVYTYEKDIRRRSMKELAERYKLRLAGALASAANRGEAP